jgi:hypothetical protein
MVGLAEISPQMMSGELSVHCRPLDGGPSGAKTRITSLLVGERRCSLSPSDYYEDPPTLVKPSSLRIVSALNEKLKMSRFSRMRRRCTLFGITMMPC